MKEQWVIILTNIIIAIAIFYLGISFSASLRNEDIRQRTSPLFKYIYDQNSGTISIDSGDDFSPVTIDWILPSSTATPLVALTKNNLSMKEDIIEKVFFLSLGGFHEKFGNLIEGDLVGYLECIVLNQFGLEVSKTLEGFPIGIKIRYIVRGNPEIKTSYNLILLRSFDGEFVQIHPFPYLEESQLRNALLEKGSYRFNEIVKRLSSYYDEKSSYMNEDGTCNQKTEQFYSF